MFASGSSAISGRSTAVSHTLRPCYDRRSVIVNSRNLFGLLIWIAAFRCANGQSIDCGNNATTESRSRTGPGGILVVLVVHSEDDHGKNSHACMANYFLRITLPDGSRDIAPGPMPPMGFSSSDAEWGRRISVHLDGFSNDGQHVFGVIAEGGKYSFVQVFDFRRDGSHSEINVELKGLSHLNAGHCGTSFAVAGTTDTGDLVLEPNTSDRCHIEHRWLLDRAGKLRELPGNASFIALSRSGEQ